MMGWDGCCPVCVCVQEIKAHPFFAGVNWASLHSQTPPYVPRVEHELDTQNFERFDEDMTMNSPGGLPQGRTHTLLQWLNT